MEVKMIGRELGDGGGGRGNVEERRWELEGQLKMKAETR